jgi:dTDP-4-amino-4,6-dideoxygalactose transaminase
MSDRSVHKGPPFREVPFHAPSFSQGERAYLQQVLDSGHLTGDGPFDRSCREWLAQRTQASAVFLTGSCTQALEMTALLAGIGPGDEVLMPSYAFVSTANAFVLRGAVPVFVDVRPETMNLDERLLEGAITSRTKAIVPLHYAGVSCNMDPIMEIAARNRLYVIEDAAQAMLASYEGRPLGGIGHFATFSFHATKSHTCGEGGALLVNIHDCVARAEVLRDKGTNRRQFLRGQVDKYTWVDVGSSFGMDEFRASVLWAQLERADSSVDHCRRLCSRYLDAFQPLADRGKLELPTTPASCEPNGHIFFIKVRDSTDRGKLIDFLKRHGVGSAFHFIPLHSSPAGRSFARFAGEDRWTSRESLRLLRLPVYPGLSFEAQDHVIDVVHAFFRAG